MFKFSYDPLFFKAKAKLFEIFSFIPVFFRSVKAFFVPTPCTESVSVRPTGPLKAMPVSSEGVVPVVYQRVFYPLVKP